MTGADHYREAEQLLEVAGKVVRLSDGSSPEVALLLAEAQVHATLALAAATALNDAEGGLSRPDWEAWKATAGEPKGGAW
ncbi:hypothetical protein [Micrococcus luteus]|uniref:hypothetical protein n=1 Tax=Micrococcus luteus TaxID=1270 RepID=UPI00332A354C